MQTVEEKRIYNKERYQRRREKQIKQARVWAVANRGRVKDRYLWRNYGITKDEYDTMRYACGFQCQICKKHEDVLGYELRVDHRHVVGYKEMEPEEKSKYIRGLLCDFCNLGVSYFDDSPERLKIAVEYIGGV